MPSSRRRTRLNERSVARALAQPIVRFLEIEAAGGILLVGATVAALVWANSPWSSSYHDLWHTTLRVGVGDHALSLDLRGWVDDGLMTLFFFVIGLEIKGELTTGQLAGGRAAAVPVVGALGGMAAPALIYALMNLGGDGAAGWGIPVATDVAFATAVLALLGRRVPAAVKVLLLGLAIVDDIGAIVVIALFYAASIHLGWLAGAAGAVALTAALRALGARHLLVYVIVGAGVWFATYESGVHATIAGVVLGLLAPARPEHRVSAEAPVAVADRLKEALHPWTSYLVVPLFALANAGVDLSADALADAAGSAVTAGVAVGLVVGKTLGVAGAVALAVRLGVARLPAGVSLRHVAGMAMLAGIGFTVSIFVAGLAFDDPRLVAEAKLGVLAASAFAAVAGGMFLWRTGSAAARPSAEGVGQGDA